MQRTLIVPLAAAGLAVALAAAPRVSSSAVPARVVDPPVQTGLVFKTVTAAEKTLKYVAYVPRDYDPAKPLPAVVFLHGQGECGTDGQKHLMIGIGTNILWNAARWPCIVLMPQKPDSRAQWEAYDAQIMAMLDAAKRDYAIDAARVLLTGLSQGGHGTLALGALHPDTWCALAPICGYTDIHGGGVSAAEIAQRIKGTPVWAFHGEADPIVPVSQSRAVIDALNFARGIAGAQGPAPRLTTYPGVKHEAWDRAYAEKDLPAFLMSAQKK